MTHFQFRRHKIKLVFILFNNNKNLIKFFLIKFTQLPHRTKREKKRRRKDQKKKKTKCLSFISFSLQTESLNDSASLSIGLGDTFDFILLLDCIRVGRSFSSIDDFISKAFGDGFDVTKRGFSCSNGNQVNCLVYTTKRRNINGLTTYSATSTNSARVFTRPSIDDGIYENLDGVLFSQEVDDLECVFYNAHGQHFLSTISSVIHQTVSQAFNSRACCLTKPLHLISSSSVWQESRIGCLDSNVILQ